MTARLDPVGFWSYARKDDQLSDKRVSLLHDRIQRELELDYGEPVVIFQDTSDITTGREWEETITDAIKQSSFLIPVITPTFLKRHWCFHEVRLFLDRERELCARHPELPQQGLIFPIGYREIRDREALDPAIMAVLRRRQWIEIEHLRERELRDPELWHEILKLVSGIFKLLQIPIESNAERNSREAEEKATAVTRAALEEESRKRKEEEDEKQTALRRIAERQTTEPKEPFEQTRKANRSRLWFDPFPHVIRPFRPGSRAVLIGFLLVAIVALAIAILMDPSGFRLPSGQVAESAKTSAPPPVLTDSKFPVETSNDSQTADEGWADRMARQVTGRSSNGDVSGSRATSRPSSPDEGPILSEEGSSALKPSARRSPEEILQRASSGRMGPEPLRGGVVPVAASFQLGAFPSRSGAEKAWVALSSRFPYLAPLSHSISEVSVVGRRAYRLRAGGPGAENICARLRVAGESCLMVK